MTLRAYTVVLLCFATQAAASNDLTIARSSAPMADQVNTLTPPRSLPHATIDTTLAGTKFATSGSFRLHYRVTLE